MSNSDEITRLTARVARLEAAVSWLEPPFVDATTPEAELRQRIGLCVADARRAAITKGESRE